MENKLKKVCETYIRNRDEMRRILRSTGSPMHLMGAAVLTALEKSADESKILVAEEFLKEREPEDSPIRGRIKSVTSVHMMLADSIENYYNDLRKTHDLIHVNRGNDDERYYMAAMMMSDKISNMQEILMLVDRTSLIHEGMGKSFTSQEDKSSYVAAAFAAVNGVKNVRAYINDVHACEDALVRSGLFAEEASELLSMLLAMVPVENEKVCKIAAEVLAAIREKGLDFASDEEAAMIAFLSTLMMSPEEIAEAVCDADDYLKEHSGFTEGQGLILRRVYASMLVTLAYLKDRGVSPFAESVREDPEILKRMVLMQCQSVMHIQMDYVDVEDLHI